MILKVDVTEKQRAALCVLIENPNNVRAHHQQLKRPFVTLKDCKDYATENQKVGFSVTIEISEDYLMATTSQLRKTPLSRLLNVLDAIERFPADKVDRSGI